MTRRRRRWVLAPVAQRPERPGPVLRPTSPADDHLVADPLDGDRPPAVVTVRDVDVQVCHLDPASPQVRELASRAMPLRHAAWLLPPRSTT